MIELQTFGEPVIRVGEREIRPSAPMLFAALLYLCVERGHRVPRAALQELLFPETDERSGAHSLRQLLYKLRQLGVPLELNSSSVSLPAHAVVERDEVPSRLRLGVLAGFSPRLSDAYTAWLDRHRAACAAHARATMVAELALARRAGDSAATVRIADNLLSLDPLNEEATLARAEALATTGQKAQAIRSLEEYSAEVGKHSRELQLPAEVLRKRIADRIGDPGPAFIPLVGRATEMAELLSEFERATAGQSTMSVVWGDAGIGKSRLLQEFRAHVSLRAALGASAGCRPHDVERPLGAVLDLLPALLRMPGAIGIDPESHVLLRRTTLRDREPDAEPPAIVAARIRLAFEELLSAIAAEQALVLMLEDTHWLDQASLGLLHECLVHASGVHIVMTSRVRPVLPAHSSFAQNIFPHCLTPLVADDSERLLRLMVGSMRPLDASLASQCVQLSGGSPLFLQAVATHLRHNATAPSSTTTLADLLRQRIALLSPKALLLVRALAILGANGSYDRLKRSLGYSTGDVLLAVQEAASAGLVSQAESRTTLAHDLVAETVRGDMPSAVSVALNDAIAQVLEEEGRTRNEPALLFACAECWVRAANPARAADVLRSCASFALQVGEPSFAIQALERAQELCRPADREAIIAETIRCADDAGDSPAVGRNVEKMRSSLGAAGRPITDSLVTELAVVNERRRAFTPVWESRDTLVRCMEDDRQSLDDRLKAARVLVVAAEEQMERSFAEHLFQRAITNLRDATSPAWLHFELTYHGTFGDLDIAQRIARQILATKTHSASANPTLLTHSGIVLFRSGAVNDALRVFQETLAIGERLRLHDRFLSAIAGAAGCIAVYADDFDLAAELQRKCAQFAGGNSDHDPPPYYANAIEIALDARDAITARAYWERVQKAHPRFLSPNRERTSIGHALTIDWLEGKRSTDELRERGWNLYQRGKTISDCDMLVVGLALDAGRSGGAILEDYFFNSRRDRFPLPAFLLRLLQSADLHLEPAKSVVATGFTLKAI